MIGRFAWLILVGVAACKQPAPTTATTTRSAPPPPAPAAPTLAPATSPPQPHGIPADAQLVEYAPDRRGFLYMPDGAGPFPVMVWNHGSEQRPGWQPKLAHFYTQHGWAFLLPHRRGHGQSPGAYIGDETDDTKVLAMQDEHNDDVAAAIEWIKHQPRVDPARVAVSGCSYGGIQTLLTAARPVGIRAAVPFAPGAMRWRVSEGLRHRLLRAAHEARVPELLIQAENDYDLSPSQIIGAELEHGGHGHAKVYPATGSTAQDGHGFCVTGFDVWGPDVLAFLAEATR
jgi:dienelactone hydrolase